LPVLCQLLLPGTFPLRSPLSKYVSLTIVYIFLRHA
jgi:hypothetical protein